MKGMQRERQYHLLSCSSAAKHLVVTHRVGHPFLGDNDFLTNTMKYFCQA